jgi:hypothetical protein
VATIKTNLYRGERRLSDVFDRLLTDMGNILPFIRT